MTTDRPQVPPHAATALPSPHQTRERRRSHHDGVETGRGPHRRADREPPSSRSPSTNCDDRRVVPGTGRSDDAVGTMRAHRRERDGCARKARARRPGPLRLDRLSGRAGRHRRRHAHRRDWRWRTHRRRDAHRRHRRRHAHRRHRRHRAHRGHRRHHAHRGDRRWRAHDARGRVRAHRAHRGVHEVADWSIRGGAGDWQDDRCREAPHGTVVFAQDEVVGAHGRGVGTGEHETADADAGERAGRNCDLPSEAEGRLS